MIRKTTTALILILLIKVASAQTPYVVDNCFMSVLPQLSFPSGFDLANNEADLMEWDGTNWIGAWANADITIKPPSGRAGCRAVFIGSGVFWTAPGEGFAFRLSQPLEADVSYSFAFTYVSHGWGCDSSFSPKLYSNDAPIFGSEKFIMSLPAVGPAWENHMITFVASADQDGHQWLFLETDPDVSSGMISSFCENCVGIATNLNETTDFNPVLYPNPAHNTLFIDLKNRSQDFTYDIYNTAGQVIVASCHQSDFNSAIDISDLPQGYYLIKMMDNGKTGVRSFIKSEK